MYKKRVTAMLLAAVMVFLVFATSGCSGSDQGATTSTGDTQSATDTSTDTSSESSGDTSGNSVPFVSSPTTVRWATYENPDPSYPYGSHLPAWQEVERITGVRVEIEAAATDDYDTSMKARLAAGVSLPDLIAIPGGATEQSRYVNAGLFVELTDLIDQHAPNLKEWYDSRPDLWGYLKAPDGGVYSVATSVEVRSMLNYFNNGIRYDWLDNLGLDTPGTVDELYNALLAFKNDDPNGNGQADEFPTVGRYDTVCWAMGWSYGLHLKHSLGWYANDNNEVVYEWITPACLDWVTEMAKWHADGLFDPDFMATQNDKYESLILGDRAGMTAYMSMIYPQWNERMVTDYPDVNWKSLMPVKAEGYEPIIEREFPYSTYYALTKDCEDPVLNIKLVDWVMASDEGFTLFNFGREGLEFHYVDGEPIYDEENVLNYERGSGLALQMLGINGNTPLILAKGCVEQRFLKFPDECAMSELSEDYKVPMFPRIIATEEEATNFARIMADIDVYTQESIIKFITGVTPLSQWDAFVDGVHSMGIDEAIKIRQAQYDRYVGGQ